MIGSDILFSPVVFFVFDECDISECGAHANARCPRSCFNVVLMSCHFSSNIIWFNPWTGFDQGSYSARITMHNIWLASEFCGWGLVESWGMGLVSVLAGTSPAVGWNWFSPVCLRGGGWHSLALGVASHS